ncbi:MULTISPECIES: hypothetical protein [unclassified Frondihabitans]|uniref:TlpA family protein disulfide reductase n=1 Tax=unclassified Frondihabitans TaxID=2626248 RepID=UPI000F4D6CA8|nr:MULTISPECIES: hypothetical protein [unclassified Frondihabitans]
MMTRRGGPIAVVVGLAVALVASGCTSQGLSQGDLTPTGAGQVTEYSVAQSRATPTTIVVDPTGRVSARILGGIDPSTLRSLIKTAATRT